MFERLGYFLARHRKGVLSLFVVALITAGSVGSLVFSRLNGGGYSDPHSDSARVVNFLHDNFHVKDPALAIVVDAGKDLKDPQVIADENSLEKSLSHENGVTQTLSYWSSGFQPTLVSRDGKSAYLFVYTANSDPSASKGLAKDVLAKYGSSYKSLHLYIGGFSAFNEAISSKISKDLAVAEAISIPLTFILLLFVFGSLVSAAMPLVVGVSAILGTFLILYLISLITDVSIFALNLTTGMGLGLGIDYSLLIVNRFREELHAGKSIEDSIARTVATAGRTVFFSGLTVFVTVGSLIMFPQMFLKSFGYAGVGVVAMAVLGALIPLPAILGILGNRVDALTIRKSAVVPREEGRWAKTARLVMRRPVAVVLITLIILGVCAAPLKNIVFSQADTRVLPASNRVAVASQFTLEKFPGQEANPIEFIIPHGAGLTTQITDYEAKIARVSGIVRVNPVQTSGDIVRFTAIHSMGPRTPAAQDLINRLRAISAPHGTLIGGVAADYADSQAGIIHSLPLVFIWIGLTVLILLFLFTGSIILPIKAVILNVLSLAAAFGVLTWVFIDGHLTWLVGTFTRTGTVDTSMVILTAIVTFGLSMDYELFLLSRIKEEHEKGKANIDAVAIGLQRSARIITAAAVLLAVVFAAFLTSGVTSIKTLGFGTALAILVDASLVRAFLVPALMRLFGEWNWWAPKWMRRFTITH